MKKLRTWVVVLLLLCLCPGVVRASVQFNMGSTGADASFSYWDLSYTLFNTSAHPVSEFDIYFDATLYTLLDPPYPNSGWNIFVYNGPFVGDSGFPYDSYVFYNAQAVGAGIAAGGDEIIMFQVAYQGIARGEVPQTQAYQTFYGISGTPVLLESGLTQLTAVPEPTTYTLLFLGLGVVVLARRRMTKIYCQLY